MTARNCSDENVVFRFPSKPKNNQPPSDAEEILKKVSTSSKEFEDAIGLARDQTIESTQAVAYYTGTKITLVHRDVSAMMRNTELFSERFDRFATEMDSRTLEFRRLFSEASKKQQKLVENAMEQQQNQLDNRNLLLQLFKESEKNNPRITILFLQKIFISLLTFDKREKISGCAQIVSILAGPKGVQWLARAD